MLSCLAPVTSLRQLVSPRRRNTPRNAKIKASLKSISSGSTSTNLHAQWCLMRDIKKSFFAPPPVTNIVFSCRDGACPVSTFTTFEICNATCSQTVCNLSSTEQSKCSKIGKRFVSNHSAPKDFGGCLVKKSKAFRRSNSFVFNRPDDAKSPSLSNGGNK